MDDGPLGRLATIYGESSVLSVFPPTSSMWVSSFLVVVAFYLSQIWRWFMSSFAMSLSFCFCVSYSVATIFEGRDLLWPFGFPLQENSKLSISPLLFLYGLVSLAVMARPIIQRLKMDSVACRVACESSVACWKVQIRKRYFGTFGCLRLETLVGWTLL